MGKTVKTFTNYPQGSTARSVKTSPVPTTIVSVPTTRYGTTKRGGKGR